MGCASRLCGDALHFIESTRLKRSGFLVPGSRFMVPHDSPRPKGVTVLDHVSTVGHPAAPHRAGAAHEEPAFLWKYVFSVDHKVIGIQYTVTSLLFLLFGFGLM